jgi:hypothetical protein
MSWTVFSTILPARLPSGLAHAECPVERGKYLASFSGCDHCHAPARLFLGKPNVSHEFSGSDIGFKVGGLGIFGAGPNLTSDKKTGLGGGTGEPIATALTTGKRHDRRILAPIMPRRSFAKTSDEAALGASQRSLPPVRNQVPFGKREAALPCNWRRPLPMPRPPRYDNMWEVSDG